MLRIGVRGPNATCTTNTRRCSIIASLGLAACDSRNCCEKTELGTDYEKGGNVSGVSIKLDTCAKVQ